MAEAPANSFVTPMEDSRRWRNIERRAGDIVISTPPKSGTTWMQGIVTSLFWPAGDAPGTRGELSPWIDMRLTPIDALAEQVSAMEHRRYFKTHSPGDCIPFDKQCNYIVVYRDGRDSLVSWGNHRRKMRQPVVEAINEAAAGAGFDPLPLTFDGDYETLFEEWRVFCSPIRHLGPWWRRRHEPNVLFVHYSDLLVDLEAEMRRIAEYLGAPVSEAQWATVVERCRIDDMRQAAEELGGLDGMFEGGASAFFNQGTNGRWTEILSDDLVDRYLALVAEDLPEDAAIWLEHGSLAVGARPDEIGHPPPTAEPRRRSHPIFGRLAKQPVNSLQAIAERRVSDAREQGLFDNLPLHGKPLPDIDQQRQPGWWANQFVAKERNKVRSLQLEEELRAARPAMWRLETEAEVVAEVDRMNSLIRDYNKRTTLAPMAAVGLDETLTTWRDLKNR